MMKLKKFFYWSSSFSDEPVFERKTRRNIGAGRYCLHVALNVIGSNRCFLECFDCLTDKNNITDWFEFFNGGGRKQVMTPSFYILKSTMLSF